VAKALEKFKIQKSKLKVKSKKLRTINILQFMKFVGIRGNSWLKLLKKSKGKTQSAKLKIESKK
jgi:hypothetical protein